MIEVGVILSERDYSVVRYKFLSLLKEDERKMLEQMVRSSQQLRQIVKFDFDYQPFSPFDNDDKLYFINHLETEEGFIYGTSVVKLSSDTLKCVEIYQSKYKIEHFSMNENNDKAPATI